MGEIDDARCAGPNGAEKVGGGGDDLGRFWGNALKNQNEGARHSVSYDVTMSGVRSQRYGEKNNISQCAYSFLSAHIHMSRATH